MSVIVLLSLVPWKFALVLLKNCKCSRCCGDGSPVTEVIESESIVVAFVSVALTGAVENAVSCCSKSAVVIGVPGVSVIGLVKDVGSSCVRCGVGGCCCVSWSSCDVVGMSRCKSVNTHGQKSPSHSWL